MLPRVCPAHRVDVGHPVFVLGTVAVRRVVVLAVAISFECVMTA